jgi:UDP-N-acetylglucosamine enolpyruvyl transferase
VPAPRARSPASSPTTETVVRDVHHVDRGYAAFVPRLQELGADIERIPAATLDA